MFVRYKKVTTIGLNRFRIETDHGTMYYYGLMHNNLEGKDVDVAVEERVDVKEGERQTVIVDYKCEQQTVSVPPMANKKELKKQEALQKKQQRMELEATFLRDILVSPALANVKGDPTKTAQKWAKAQADWILRGNK